MAYLWRRLSESQRAEVLADRQMNRRPWRRPPHFDQGNTFYHLTADGHFWATVNYIHHNPVKHGYVEKWDEWPYSSAVDYLREIGREEATAVWKSYPLLDYGKGWDD